MQDAKDSFYKMLRDRLAVLNSDHTIVVRGVTRPAILVDENETGSTAALKECFHLQWKDTEVIVQGAYPLVTQRCEITYSTEGTTWNAGLDRGRTLAAMDAELMAAVRQFPQNTVKNVYSAPAQGDVARATASRIWWSDVSFGAVRAEEDQLTRVVTIEVMCFEEGMSDDDL